MKEKLYSAFVYAVGSSEFCLRWAASLRGPDHLSLGLLKPARHRLGREEPLWCSKDPVHLPDNVKVRVDSQRKLWLSQSSEPRC